LQKNIEQSFEQGRRSSEEIAEAEGELFGLIMLNENSPA
jgi:hypothetical protein